MKSGTKMLGGQSLIEVLIAVSLAGLFLGGTVMVFSGILTADKRNREIQAAIELGNELSDRVVVYAAADWHNLDRLSTSSVITVEGVAVASSSDASTTIFSHTTLGDNRLLVVAVASRDLSLSDRTVSRITYGPVDLVRITTNNAAVSQENSEIWYLPAAPSLGSHDLKVDFGGVVDDFSLAAISLNGVDQTNRVDTSVGLTSGGTPGNPSINLTAVYNNSLVIDALTYGNDVNFNPGSGQVELWDIPLGDLGSTGSYRGPLSAGQTVSMNHSKSGGGASEWAMSAASFRLAAEIASYNYYLEATSTGLVLKNGEETVVKNGITYTRYYYVENVSRDINGNIEDVYNGANNDPSTRKVIVRVIWGGNPSGLIFSEILARSRNEAFRQTNWTVGAGQENFPGEEANDRFSTSSGMDFGSQGSIKSQTGLASGTLISSTFETSYVSVEGAALNSIMWQGSLGSQSTVKFKVASSNCPNGETNYPTCNTGTWQYLGAAGGSDNSDWYNASNKDTPVSLRITDHNNKRYFRYKILIEVSGGGTSPSVEDVIINWSP